MGSSDMCARSRTEKGGLVRSLAMESSQPKQLHAAMTVLFDGSAAQNADPGKTWLPPRVTCMHATTPQRAAVPIAQKRKMHTPSRWRHCDKRHTGCVQSTLSAASSRASRLRSSLSVRESICHPFASIRPRAPPSKSDSLYTMPPSISCNHLPKW